eukprot:3933904-Rhodomonas_salina.2
MHSQDSQSCKLETFRDSLELGHQVSDPSEGCAQSADAPSRIRRWGGEEGKRSTARPGAAVMSLDTGRGGLGPSSLSTLCLQRLLCQSPLFKFGPRLWDDGGSRAQADLGGVHPWRWVGRLDESLLDGALHGVVSLHRVAPRAQRLLPKRNGRARPSVNSQGQAKMMPASV